MIVTGTSTSGQTGAELTTVAFTNGFGTVFGQYIVSIGLAMFAYSTILGWSYYGEKSIEFLMGERAIKPYRYVFVLFVGVGAIAELDLVWSIADIFNGLMAFPNLIGLILLTPIIVSETRNYFSNGSSR